MYKYCVRDCRFLNVRFRVVFMIIYYDLRPKCHEGCYYDFYILKSVSGFTQIIGEPKRIIKQWVEPLNGDD